MIRLLTIHLAQSTLFATAAGLLTLAFRKNRAQVRYWLWLTASIKFLIPFALLISLGSALETWSPDAHHIAEQITTPAVAWTVEQLGEPLASAALPSSSAPTIDWVPVAIEGTWLCGFAAIALLRFRSWRRVRDAVRASTLIDVPAPVDVRISPGLLEPGVVGILRPVLLLPEGILNRLTPSELEAVLAHELCHIRRRDNLFALIHMLVEAMFWFHPLVWWIGARLVDERERACDEEVLNQGNQPEVYADAILNVCKLYTESPLACVSGVTGAGIKRRIEVIMSSRRMPGLNRAKKFLLAAAGFVALAGPLAIGLANAPEGKAQSKPASGTAPTFEVASVRPADRRSADAGMKTAEGSGQGPSIEVEHERFTAVNFNLFGLIVKAYGIAGCRPLGGGNCVLLAGGPDWLTKEGFDVEARMPDGSPDYTLVQLQNGQAPQLQLMLQKLLADRFHLVVHHETRQVPVYALTRGKRTPKFTRAKESEERFLRFHSSVPGGQSMIQLVVQNSSMRELADLYSKFMDRPVIDQTGLADRYDLTVEYEPDSDAPGGFAAIASPSLFRAFQEIGLSLEATKGPVDVLVIDSVQHPSKN